MQFCVPPGGDFGLQGGDVLPLHRSERPSPLCVHRGTIAVIGSCHEGICEDRSG